MNNIKNEDVELKLNDSVLTDDQVSMVYNELEKDNKDADLLSKAQEETESIEYDSIEEINTNDDEDISETMNLDSDEELPPDEALKKSLKESNENATDEDIQTIIRLLIDYKKDKTITLYDKLPESYKAIINGIKAEINMGRRRDQLIGREFICKIYFDNIVGDAQFDAIFDEFNKSIDEAYKEFGVEMSNLFNEAYTDLFSKIDEIREEDPEKAQKIEDLKKAFDSAKSMDRLLDWVGNCKRKRLYKRAELYFRDEVSYFNSKVNTTDIKVPDAAKLLDVLKLYVPEKNELEHKRFVTAICQHADDLDINNINELAYIYKLVDNIYKYTFLPATDEILNDDNTKEIFDNVRKVIDKINSLQGGN